MISNVGDVNDQQITKQQDKSVITCIKDIINEKTFRVKVDIPTRVFIETFSSIAWRFSNKHAIKQLQIIESGLRHFSVINNL